MPNNNVAILSIMSKFDEKSAREAAKRADKVYEEALSDIGNVNFDKKLIENFDKAMNLLKNKFKKVNLSSYTNSLLDSIFSDKDIKEKSKDIELFISKIEMLKKASSGQDINAFNTFSAKQIDALISRTEKLAQKQEEINEKTREYNREATKIAKANRSISTIDKNYGNQDYSKTLESLKKSLGTEKEFTAEQNQSIENLAKMVNLYQTIEKSEPQKGTAEAIRYSKDLLAVTQKIKEERDKIDAFSKKSASTYITNNGLSSIDKVSDYTISKSKEDFVKASLSNLKSQEAKLQSELTTYISESVQKNLSKVSKEVDAVVDKAEKRVENLQNKIESLQNKSAKTGSDNSIIGDIVSNSDIKTLEEIEDRLFAIQDKYLEVDENGYATNDLSTKELKEFISLYKEYEQLPSDNKFESDLPDTYKSIIESDENLQKYADTLDKTISKQKEFNEISSNDDKLNNKPDKLSSIDADKLETDLNEIKETIIEISKKVDNLNSENSFSELSSQVGILDEKLNNVNGSVDKLVESIQLLSSLSLSDLQKTLIPIYNGINQVYKDNNGNRISGYWNALKQEVESSNTELKNLLKTIGLFDSKSNSLKLINDGMENSGGIIGDDKVLIARKNRGDRFEEKTELKKRLDEAYEAGINVSRILDIIGTKESNVFFDIQEKASGNILGNIYGQNEEDFVNMDWLYATDEQIKKLVADMIKLQEMGINVESNLTNIMYDKEKGFSFIDMDLGITDFENNAELMQDHMTRIFGDLEDFYIDKNDSVNENLIKSVRERFENLSKQVQEAYANAQDSNSPSKEFEKLENDAVDGVVVGANENEEKLKNVGKQMAENVKAGFKESISEIGSELNLDKSNISSGIQIEDVFQGETEKSGMDAIASATEEAVQAKKDFATANEGVQSSIDGSKSPLQLEAELMDQIAKSAREAADAKKEFVEANKHAKDSVADTNEEKKRENTEENTNAWKELTYSIQRYSEVSKRISSGKALEGDIEEASRLENKISQLQKLDILSPTQIEKSEQMLTKLYDSLDDIEKKSKETTLESLNSSIDKYRNDYNSRSSKPFVDNQSDQYKKLLANYETSIKELEAYRDKIRNNPLVSKEDLNQIDELTKKVKESATAFNSLTASQKGSTPLSRGKAIEWANDLLEQNSKWSKKAKIEVQGWINKLATADPSNVEEIRNRILEVVRAEREAGNAGKTWLDIFSTKKLHNFLGQAASMFSFYDLIRYVKEGTSAVKEFDDGLTKISYTMDMAKSQLDDLGQSVLDMASDMKTSLDDAMSVAQIYANMNTTAEEIQKLSEPTLILSNLTGFDASTVADDIQAVTQQFDILAEDSMHIADVYDYISRNISVDYSKGIESIAEAVQVAGSTAKQAGLEYEQLAAIVGKTAEKTRLEGSQIGNGLKTIMTRLSKVGELSDEVDNETMSDASESLHKIGIEVYNADGSFRQFDVIMGELANKWSDLTDAEKSNISFAIAATRQTNLLSAILSNFTDSMQLAEEATNAEGSALENQQKYMDSFAGHLQSLETEAKIAWINILNSETLKNGVDLLTSLVKVVGQLIDKFGILGTAGITMGAVQGFKKLDYASV